MQSSRKLQLEQATLILVELMCVKTFVLMQVNFLELLPPYYGAQI